jgi:glycosyltransferase involved in cell wall biosynthesis
VTTNAAAAGSPRPAAGISPTISAIERILAAVAIALQFLVAGVSTGGGRDVQQRPTVDVVIPIYNERASVEELVRRLRQSCPQARLLFVDNASTDGTVEWLEAQEEIGLVRHESNLGYGQSLIDGLQAGSGELVVQIDADLEYRPEDVPALVEALGTAEAVYGSRFLGARGGGLDMAWHRSLGNRCVTALFNLLFRQRLTDLYTGIRAFRRSALDLPLHRPGFEFVLEVAVRLARRGVRIREVPVGYDPRRSGESKMRHLRELAKFAYWLVRLRLSRDPSGGGAPVHPGARSSRDDTTGPE